MKREAKGFTAANRVFLTAMFLCLCAVGCRPEVTLNPPDLPSLSDLRITAHTDYRWTLQRLDGTRVDFSEFRGKVVFLNFWATWCPPCTAELPNIQRLYETLKTEDIVFVNSSYQAQVVVQTFASETGLDLPLYLHGSYVPPIFISNRGIPVTFIINREGGIVYEHIGPARWDDESVLRFIRDLL